MQRYLSFLCDVNSAERAGGRNNNIGSSLLVPSTGVATPGHIVSVPGGFLHRTLSPLMCSGDSDDEMGKQRKKSPSQGAALDQALRSCEQEERLDLASYSSASDNGEDLSVKDQLLRAKAAGEARPLRRARVTPAVASQACCATTSVKEALQARGGTGELVTGFHIIQTSSTTTRPITELGDSEDD